MDWFKPCAYDGAQTRNFHITGMKRLGQLATALKFERGTFDLRSNAGVIAVSGEVILHHDRLYVQISQPAARADIGILIRASNGRRDYTGGRNHFASLSLLDDIPRLAKLCRSIIGWQVLP